MSVGFGAVADDGGSGGGGSSLSLTGVVSGQPILLWAAGTSMPSISDTFATSYTWTQAASVDGQLIVGTGGSGTSGTINGSGLILAQSLTGASLASGTAILDASATSTSNTGTASVTPTQSGDAVCAFIFSSAQGIAFTGTVLDRGNEVVGYPIWIETGTTGVASGTPVSYGFSSFGRGAWSIICAILAEVVPPQLVMLV